MVVIRSLQPSIDIRMPSKTPGYRPSKAFSEVRWARDHPSPTPQPTPCRLWQGPVDEHGYGTMWRVMNRRGNEGFTRVKTRPHRWVVEQVLGRKLKSEEVVMHLCDNPLCYRYSHLQVGSYRDNNHDMMAKGRYRHAGGKKRPTLTAAQVSKIVRMYLSGLTQSTIAEEMGISKAEVTKHVSGLNGAWRWHRAR